MCNTEIGYFCSIYDNWRELLIEEPYCLKIKEESPYVIFNYNQIQSDFSNSIVREARGIIFRVGEWENPVCWAFDKFGNYGESYVPNIDWSTAFVTEKIDGTLIKLWFDNGDWHISTNGIIEAHDAKIGDARMPDFGKYFHDTFYKTVEPCCGPFIYFVDKLNTNYTYMFELVGPFNRVVIPYEEPALYFLGARNKYTGEELNCSSDSAKALGLSSFKLPKQYPLTSLNECIKMTEEYSWDQEGFVVVDSQFNRVKIKSPAYVLAHFMRNNNIITRKHLIRIILMNEVEEFLCYAADYKNVLLETQHLMTAYLTVGNKLVEICRKSRALPRASYAELVKTFPKIFQGVLYYNYQSEEPFTIEAYSKNWHENKWEEYLSDFEKLEQKYLDLGKI